MPSPQTTRIAIQRYLESGATCEIAYRDERQRPAAGRVNAMPICHGASGVAKVGDREISSFEISQVLVSVLSIESALAACAPDARASAKGGPALTAPEFEACVPASGDQDVQLEGCENVEN